ncbi:MAG: hypothetical protein OEM01_04770 [Desulfobulbaceae bacterium]|nr:hypothetical protein [Desulfobulbaceae bacterium]
MKKILVVFIFLLLALVTDSFADSPRVMKAGFVVQNGSNEEATVAIYFYNPDGSEAHHITQTLASSSSSLIDLDAIDELTPGWSGSAVISSDNVLAGAGWAETFSKYGRPEGMGWYNLPGAGYTPVYVPLIRNNPANGFEFNLWIQNAGSADAAVTVTYYALGGGSSSSTCPDLTPGASLDSINSCSPSLPDPFVGSAVVSSNQPVVVVANQSNPAKMTECLYNGIPGSGADEELFFPIVQNNYQGWYSSFTVQNMGTSTAQGNFNYYSDCGSATCALVDSLPSDSITPGYGYVFTPVTSPFSGYGKFVTTSGQTFGSVASVWNDPAKAGYCYNGFGGGISYPVPEESTWYVPGVNSDSRIVVKNTNESTGGTVTVSWLGLSAQQTVVLSANGKQVITPAVPAGWSGSAKIEATTALPLAIVVQNVQPGGNDRGAYKAYGQDMGVTNLFVTQRGAMYLYVPRVRKAQQFLSTIWKVYNPAILKGAKGEE